MKNIRRFLPLVFLIVMMLSPIFVMPQNSMQDSTTNPTNQSDGVRLVDIGNGEYIEVGPNEELYRYTLSDQGWSLWTGTSDPLSGDEFGNSTNIFADRQMDYIPGSGTSNVQVNIPTGTDWEAYQTDVSITQLTENRTWITNPGFDTGYTDWTRVPTSSSGSSTVSATWEANGHGTGDACVQVDINSNSASQPYYYDAGDAAWYRQTTTVNRGSVVWAGFRFDYWADTVDDTHYGMTGSFRLYTNIAGTDVWRKVFSDIGAEETWYSTGLSSVNPSIFSLPSVTTEIGLYSLASVGYAPNIHPRARFDNVELFMKTLVNPSEINMQMDSLSISNGASRGTCSITEIPASPWATSPVQLTFSWTPIPSTPNPNDVIYVDFDVDVNMYARSLD